LPRPKLNTRQQVILLIALVAMTAIVAAVNWAGRRKADLYGPTVIAKATDGRIWLALNHELHVLEPNGVSIRRTPVRALGIEPPIAALAPGADGAMVVGSRETGLLHVIDANGVPHATIDPAAGRGRRLFGAFHLLPLPDAQGWVVADTSNHRVLHLGIDGRVLKSYGSTDGRPGVLHFPNGLAPGEAGNFVLVDTNHHLVVTLTPSLEPVRKRTFVAQADRGYVWPALIATAPDGARFVSIMANGMERGRVFKYDREGNRLLELALPALADPSGLLVRAEDVLVSDQQGLAIRRFGLDGSSLGTFGDESLQAALRDVERKRALYRTTITGGQVSLVGILIVLLLFLRRERQTQESLGATYALQVTEYRKPGRLRVLSYSIWVALRVAFVFLAVNLAANIALWYVSRRVMTWPMLAEDGLYFLLLVVAPCAVGVWHFDQNLEAGNYRDIMNFGAQTLLRRLGAKLDGLLRSGERIEQLAVSATVLGRVRLLLLTPERFLVLTLRVNLRDLARAQELPRRVVSRATARKNSVPYILRLVGILSTTSVEVEVAGTRRAFPVLDPLAARELAEALSLTRIGAGADAACWRDVLVQPRAEAGIIVPLGLSAFLPGLGQLRQERLGMGILFLLCAAIWALQTMRPLIAMVRKTAEVHPAAPLIAVAGYAVIWSISLLDTYLAARADA